MICSKCGKNNKENSKFCAGCGVRLSVPDPVESTARYVDPEDEKTMLMPDTENEKTEIMYDMDAFENEETVILDDTENAFENEETVILDDTERVFENEKTVLLNDFENEETVILDDVSGQSHDSIKEDVPNFDYYGNVPVFKEDVSGTYHDTAYIDHLRALKQLWDDGVITEDEFTRKKQQILGI